ncbi:LLM class flavin-dependent oxidoreductase [Streptomyces sp.]|uniref:LLM class flavin-dependent oxidoreductase n=1 Tax=Streptomyces sp. TaxID=1931 RepID=UPI002F411428
MTYDAPAPAGPSSPFRLGFFTRLVDQVSPAEVYGRALDLFQAAEDLGFDTGWVAQHHFAIEGGLPAPMVFLTAAAARTRRLTLATGIITLPLEEPLRLAEEAAVLDVLSGGRLELGFGTGGGASTFAAFGRGLDDRREAFATGFATVRDAVAGRPLTEDGLVLYPPRPGLGDRFWHATFSADGARRIGEQGVGLLLARTAARPGGGPPVPPDASLGDLQTPLVDAYLDAWPAEAGPPRIGLSRSVYITTDRRTAVADAEQGIQAMAEVLARGGTLPPGLTTEDYLRMSYVSCGSPDDVIASLAADPLLPRSTDLICQVHPLDPSHDKTLRSLELLATEVAPALGWRPAARGGTDGKAAADAAKEASYAADGTTGAAPAIVRQTTERLLA